MKRNCFKGQITLEVLLNFLIYLSILIILSTGLINYAKSNNLFIDFVKLKVKLEEMATTYDILAFSKNKWIDTSKTNFIFQNRTIYIVYENQTIKRSTIGYLNDKNYEPV
ncbi:MAG: hypothetical protein AABX38_02740 [Candidatus Micrarchaeota archaeon]